MIRLLRNDTELIADIVGKAGANMGANYTWMGGVGNTNYLDSPATTVEVEYRTQFKNNRNGAVVTVQTDSSTSTITLLEIGA